MAKKKSKKKAGKAAAEINPSVKGKKPTPKNTSGKKHAAKHGNQRKMAKNPKHFDAPIEQKVETADIRVAQSQNTPQEATGAPLRPLTVPDSQGSTQNIITGEGHQEPDRGIRGSTQPNTQNHNDDADHGDIEKHQNIDLLYTTIPDKWRIDTDFEPPLLTFEIANKRIASVPLGFDFLEDVLPGLNALHVSTAEAADTWEIRLPEDVKQPPVFSLTRQGAVVASISLDQDVIDALIPAIRTFDKSEVIARGTRRERLRKWMKRHRFWSIVLIILATPIIGYILYAIGMEIFFTGTR